MKILNSKGFSLAEVLIIVVVVGALAGAGTVVYKTQNKMPNKQTAITNFDECVAAGNPVAESYPEQCSANGKTFTRKLSAEEKKKLNPETAGWKTYEGDGFSISYPTSWRQFTPQSGTGSDASFVSKDYKEATELGPSVMAGYWLEVYVSDTLVKSGEEYPEASFSSYEERLNYLETEEQGCGGDYKTIKVDELPAIYSTLKCHGSYAEAYVYKNNKEYMFRLNSLNEADSKNKELFNNILSTVVLD